MSQLSQTEPKRKLVSGNHIFREGDHGKLEFIGNFEALYQSESDPWFQSGTGEDIAAYYAWSRQRLIAQLETLSPTSILEVGCGLGYVTQELDQAFPHAHVAGMDISHTAIHKAREIFPHPTFEQGNICSDTFQSSRHYDVVILSQILWYIIEAFPVALDNCSRLIGDGGHLVFTNAFLRSPQRYAADIIDGFQGLIDYLEQNAASTFRITASDYDDSHQFHHHDGLVVLSPT